MMLGRRTSGAGLLAAVIAALAGSASCATYCVQLKGDPAVLRLPENYKLTAGANQRTAAVAAATAAVDAEHASFATAAAKIKFDTEYTYKQVFNGLSVKLSGTEKQINATVKALKALPQVKAITKVRLYKKLNPNHRKFAERAPVESQRRRLQQDGPAPAPGPPPLNYPLDETLYNGKTTGAYDVNTKLGITGLGIKAGIIDTGVDYLHPDLGGGFGPGYRVITGYDFVGDEGTGDYDYGVQLYPDNDPRDTCDGHGTHVAGILGANGNVVGQAPDVSFGAYRVFGCDGFAANVVIIAAAELAYKDGMDVINLSLGSGPTWPASGPDAILNEVLANMVYAGLFVAVAAGNAGGIQGFDVQPQGLGMFGVSSPSNVQAVLSIAASENTIGFTYQFVVDPGAVTIDYSGNDGTIGDFPTDTPLGLVPSYIYSYDSTGAPTTLPADDACEASSINPLVSGNIAVVRRGTCTFTLKAANLAAAGATGMVAYNNVPGDIEIGATGLAKGFGLASISADEGLTIVKLLNKGDITATFSSLLFEVPDPLAGSVTDFSSYGPAVDLSFKPDIAAPGAVILSTYPLPLGAYAQLEGTSMATPNLAGAAALVLQTKPAFSAANVRYQLQNTATPLLDISDAGTLTTKPAPVHIQGAGQVNIYAALTYGLNQRLVPSSVSFGSGNGGTASIRVDNGGSTPVTYQLSHQPALAQLYSTDVTAQAKVEADATASISTTSLTVPAGGTMNFDFTITAPASLPANSMYGGWVVLTAAAGVSRVPYIGWKGDFSKLDVLDFIVVSKFDLLGTNDLNLPIEDGADHGVVGSIRNQKFDFQTTFPQFGFNLYLPARHFTAVLTYLGTPSFEILVVDQPYPLGVASGAFIPNATVSYGYQLSNQALQSEFITFGDGYKFSLPDDDYTDFGCTIPNGAYQLTFTIVSTGGLTKTYVGPETLFNIVNAPPTMTPYCAFTPVVKPTKVPAVTTPGTAGKAKPTPRAASTAKKPTKKPTVHKPTPRKVSTAPKPKPRKALPRPTPRKTSTSKAHPKPAAKRKASTASKKPHRKPVSKGHKG